MKRAIHIVWAGALLAVIGILSQGVARAQVVRPYPAFYQKQLNQQPFSPYNPYLTPLGVGYGVSLTGQAEVMRAYAKVVSDQEAARILREQANRANSGPGYFRKFFAPSKDRK